MSGFDFAAFREAFEARDAARWLAFYAPDAEWLEYRAANPPRAPNVMRGHDEIEALLRGVAAAAIEITIENEVLDVRRAAFTIIVEREDGRRIVEKTIIDHRDGLVVRQIDVEAWD